MGSISKLASMESMMIMSLLMRRREACGLTRQDVAQAIGCAVDTLRKIETGAIRPSLLLVETHM